MTRRMRTLEEMQELNAKALNDLAMFRVEQQRATNPTVNLCVKHSQSSDWSDKDIDIVGKQSCDICKEK